MSIGELREDELLQRLSGNSGYEAVLFHTVFCGTCKLAERMLEIVQAVGTTVPVHKVNINYAPGLRDSWKISSVPCLVLLRGGEPVRFEYTMRSVDHLYALLKELESSAAEKE
ncbi:thioredoxin family protein [Paenibacillus sepulcri]|uniref:Thioredoxin family protein n=1 Tax=Paenibacillus sepulcri TaxID=359917 RepID=A0ABS7C3U3_9BACL|nr:thioredoxin family protein [Paenibacillus sepulcri]